LEKCNAFVFYPERGSHTNLANINQFILNYLPQHSNAVNLGKKHSYVWYTRFSVYIRQEHRMSSETGVGALTMRPTCGIHGLVNGLIRNEVVLFSC